RSPVRPSSSSGRPVPDAQQLLVSCPLSRPYAVAAAPWPAHLPTSGCIMKWLIGSASVLLLSGTFLALYAAGVFDSDDDTRTDGVVRDLDGDPVLVGEGPAVIKPELKFSQSEPADQLVPASFVSSNGARKGWKVVLPGNHPLATPAVVDGK